MDKKISLVTDTIDNSDIDSLIEWLKEYPRLTKGNLTVQVEKKFADWIGCKYSVFVNSGSSANLIMMYAAQRAGYVSAGDVVLAPNLSWSTTVSPIIQLGMKPVLVDCELNTLGICPVDLKDKIEQLIRYDMKPTVLMLTHMLGFVSEIEQIKEICDEYGIVIIEDSCETLGSTNLAIKTGNFGIMSSFSTYFGHHISTIEGGFVCTNDKDLYDLLLMLRSHGWDRDLDDSKKEELRSTHSVNEFDAMYTFYQPSFNLRSTDLQAFIGLRQIDKLDRICLRREQNFRQYDISVQNDYWKVNPFRYACADRISNFAYPIIHPKRESIIDSLNRHGIENRPLVCGSMASQPFMKEVSSCDVLSELNNPDKFPNSKKCDEYGLYVPNHHGLNTDDINEIADAVNEGIND